MEASEYEELLKDPSSYLLRTVVPAQNTTLEPLKMFPELSFMTMMFSGFSFMSYFFIIIFYNTFFFL